MTSIVVSFHLGTQAVREGKPSKYKLVLLQAKRSLTVDVNGHCCQLICRTIETEWATHNIHHSTSTCVIVQRAPNCYISIVNNYAIYWHFTMTNWIFKFFLFTLFISLARSFWPRSLKKSTKCISCRSTRNFISIFEI